MTKFVNKHYVTIRNNTNDKDFFGKGVGNRFGKYLKALFKLYEYHHHRNVIIMRKAEHENKFHHSEPARHLAKHPTNVYT